LKRKKISISEDRQVLSWAIVSTQFLKEIRTLGEPELFETRYSVRVASWVWEYFDNTGESPGQTIEEIFIRRRTEIPDEDEIDLVQEYLSALSTEWERVASINHTYAVTQATAYFKRRSLERFSESLDKLIKRGEIAEAEREIGSYKRVEKPTGSTVSMIRHAEPVISAILAEDEIMFAFDGDLGKAIGPFIRGDLVAFLGAPGRGKTWWLLYLAYRAMSLHLGVVFFSLEMTEHQVIRRAWQMMMGKAVRECESTRPSFEPFDDDDEEFRVISAPYTPELVTAHGVQHRQNQWKMSLRDGDFRIKAFPSFSATLSDIRTTLDNLEYYEGFVPDVIAVDYGDIIKPEGHRGEYRHDIDEIWKTMRGWAQERNCLVASATQAGRKAIGKDARESDIAEDIRKLNHVSKMMILNQSKDEYDAGVMRVRSGKEREGRLITSEVVVLQDLAVGRPYIASKFADKVDLHNINGN
jgi:replicative DNA helicase